MLLKKETCFVYFGDAHKLILTVHVDLLILLPNTGSAENVCSPSGDDLFINAPNLLLLFNLHYSEVHQHSNFPQYITCKQTQISDFFSSKISED